MNYNEVFKCTICYLDYEQSIRRPMIICRNHHTICEVCLDKICDKSDFSFNCPICRAFSKKEDALYNKSFFNYRQVAEDLISQKNTIKANQKQLKDGLKILEEKLSNYNSELRYQMIRAQQKEIQIYGLRKDINNCHSQEERLKKHIDKLSYQGENYRENIEKLKEENSFLSQQNNKLLQRIRQSQIQLLKIEECMIRESKMKEQLKQKLYSQRENHASEKQELARQLEQLVVQNKNKIETLQSSNKMDIRALEDTIFDYTSRILKLQQQLKQKEQIYEGNCEKLSQILQARELEIQSLRKSNKDYWDRLSSLQQRYDDEAAMKRVLHRTVDNLNRTSNQNRNLINELREENKKLLQKTAELQKEQNLEIKNKGFFSSLFK